MHPVKITTTAEKELQINMSRILHEYYPALFESLHALTNIITFSADGIPEPTGIVQKIFTELDTMYRKEKYVLFPYIYTLHVQHKNAATCAPFKQIKSHATAILTLLQNLKRFLSDVNQKKNIGLVVNFESGLIRMQKEKEQHIFSPVRKCTGCLLQKDGKENIASGGEYRFIAKAT